MSIYVHICVYMCTNMYLYTLFALFSRFGESMVDTLYQSVYFLMTEDPLIIPVSILSYDRGSLNHTSQYTFL